MTDSSTIKSFVYKSNLNKRILATIIDYGLFLLYFIAYLDYFGEHNQDGEQTVSGLLALSIPIVWFLYFIGVESIFGATAGHLAMNLKVLSLNRRPIDFIQSTKRHMFDFFDFGLYGIPAIIAIKRTDKHQRLGDLWARTIVVDMGDPTQTGGFDS